MDERNSKMKNLEEILNNEAPSHLYPFFWQKGQSSEKIAEYMDQMYAQGIRNFCIESRPHPEFLEDGWWKTMDMIIEKAQGMGMHMWILDDDKFPTGHANGKVPEELRRRYLRYHCFDVHSDGSEIQLNMRYLCGMRKLMQDKRHLKDRTIAVIAVKKNIQEHNRIIEGTESDLTECLEDGVLTCTLPKGPWSIFAVYETLCSDGRGVEEYLDPMRREATEVLLSEVYEKHYAHYAEHFGKTIIGFFSDEPSFGNANGRQEVIGKSEMPLPWNEEVSRQFLERGFETKDLVYLFRGEEKHASDVRYNYMDIITDLYRKNFTDTLGEWCRSHGVIYVGHVIEDDNVHARLGALINDVISSSIDKNHIVMSPDYESAMQSLRRWMFSNVYIGGKAKEEEGKAQQMLELLFHYYMDHPDRLTPEYIRLMERGESRERVVCDYISGMTDNYAIEKFEELFVPIGWKF